MDSVAEVCMESRTAFCKFSSLEVEEREDLWSDN